MYYDKNYENICKWMHKSSFETCVSDFSLRKHFELVESYTTQQLS